MREINERFINDLKNGCLFFFLEKVKVRRNELCLEIRDGYINIYYKGGNLLKIQQKKNGYRFYFDAKYCLNIDKSKEGRNRIALVAPSKQKEVERILSDRIANHQEKICSKVHFAMDVHSYRRSYAKEIYKQLARDKEFRDDILQCYPTRTENVKSDTYISRKTKEHFDRNSTYIVSKCLGHNRLSVSVNHYLI